MLYITAETITRKLLPSGLFPTQTVYTSGKRKGVKVPKREAFKAK